MTSLAIHHPSSHHSIHDLTTAVLATPGKIVMAFMDLVSRPFGITK